MKIKEILEKARRFKRTTEAILRKILPYGFLTRVYVRFLVRAYNEGKTPNRFWPFAKVSAYLLNALELFVEAIVTCIVFAFLLGRFISQ